MSFRPLNSFNSLDQNFGQATDMFRELYARETVEIYKDNTGTRRVLLGKGANNFYGLRVSKTGFDVYDTADTNLAFNSNQNVFKIVQILTSSITAPANVNNITTIPHGLTYTPAVIGFLEAGIASNTRTPLPTWTGLSRDDTNHVINFRTWINLEANQTNVYINFFNSTAASIGPLNVTIYLLQESAT